MAVDGELRPRRGHSGEARERIIARTRCASGSSKGVSAMAPHLGRRQRLAPASGSRDVRAGSDAVLVADDLHQ